MCPNHAEVCANRVWQEHCTVRANVDVYVMATYYDVETCCDYIQIGTKQFRGTGNGPLNEYMPAGSTLSWQSDGSVVAGVRLPFPSPEKATTTVRYTLCLLHQPEAHQRGTMRMPPTACGRASTDSA